MRRFVLVRDSDVSGVSGVGLKVFGIQFPDGVCAYRWNTEWRTTCIADSVAEIVRIHGHEGATRLVWIDTPEAGRVWREVKDGGGAAGQP